MKRILHLSVILFLLSAASGFAQTQKGYVKTKGRMDANGNIIAGKRLSGVTIQPSERQAVVSRSDGSFSFPVPHSLFSIQSVYKDGFVLADPDILSRQYSYSINPFVLVLEVPEEQLEDMLLAQRKIRRTLRRQLQEKEEELDSLRALQRITEGDYRQALQALYAQQDINEDLVNDMAERYSKLDFDGMDEFNRQICRLILDGKLTEADSLINAKGSFNTRVSTLLEHQDAIAKEEQLLRTRQSRLEKSKAMARAELEDLARDCNSKYEIFKMQHLNDSAAYYAEVRAALDTANIKWQVEAGVFLYKYLSEFHQAELYFNRALQTAVSTRDSLSFMDISMEIGLLQQTKSSFEESIKSFDSVEEIACRLNDLDYLTLSAIEKATTICLMGDLSKAYDIFLDTSKNINDVSTQTQAMFYDNMASVELALGYFDKAIEHYLKAGDLLSNLKDSDAPEFAGLYNNLSVAYSYVGNYVEYERYLNMALERYTLFYGSEHPTIAHVYESQGIEALYSGDFQTAIYMLNCALEIYLKVYGEDDIRVSLVYIDLGSAYQKAQDYMEALIYFQKSEKILTRINPDSSDLLYLYLST